MTGAKQVADSLVNRLSKGVNRLSKGISRLNKGDEVAILEGNWTSFNGPQRRLGFEAPMQESAMAIVNGQ